MARNLDELYVYALSLFGTPYQWGGGHDGSIKPFGLDCSGLVRKILAYAGAEPKGDHTAEGLYEYFSKNQVKCVPTLGALSFFGKEFNIHHVGFCIDARVMLSAAGGGPHITTREAAYRENAEAKIEPLALRKDFVCSFMPSYKF